MDFMEIPCLTYLAQEGLVDRSLGSPGDIWEQLAFSPSAVSVASGQKARRLKMLKFF